MLPDKIKIYPKPVYVGNFFNSCTTVTSSYIEETESWVVEVYDHNQNLLYIDLLSRQFIEGSFKHIMHYEQAIVNLFAAVDLNTKKP